MTEQELFDRSIPEPNTGCWLWLGNGTARDGRARYRGQHVGRLFFGLTDPDQHALHHCDQPVCVNPEHMYVGDQVQNMADMSRRKRARRHVGNRFNTRLTPETVKAIRSDPRTQREIAAEYGVAQTTISHCLTRRTWKDCQ